MTKLQVTSLQTPRHQCTCFNRVRYCSVRKVIENSSLRLKSLVKKPFLCVGWVSWYLSLSVYLAPYAGCEVVDNQKLTGLQAGDFMLLFAARCTSDTHGCFFSR